MLFPNTLCNHWESNSCHSAQLHFLQRPKFTTLYQLSYRGNGYVFAIRQLLKSRLSLTRCLLFFSFVSTCHKTRWRRRRSEVNWFRILWQLGTIEDEITAEKTREKPENRKLRQRKNRWDDCSGIQIYVWSQLGRFKPVNINVCFFGYWTKIVYFKFKPHLIICRENLQFSSE